MKKIIIILILILVGSISIYFVIKNNREKNKLKKNKLKPDNILCENIPEKDQKKCEESFEIDEKNNKKKCYYNDEIGSCSSVKPRHGTCKSISYVKNNKEQYMNFTANKEGTFCGSGEWELDGKEKGADSGRVVLQDKIGGSDMMECCPTLEGGIDPNPKKENCWNFDDYTHKGHKPCKNECGFTVKPKLKDIMSSDGKHHPKCNPESPIKLDVTWLAGSKELYEVTGYCDENIIQNSTTTCNLYNKEKCESNHENCNWYDKAVSLECSQLTLPDSDKQETPSELEKQIKCNSSEKGCIWQNGSCTSQGKCKSKKNSDSKPFICCKRSSKQAECYNYKKSSEPDNTSLIKNECTLDSKCEEKSPQCANCSNRCYPKSINDYSELVDCGDAKCSRNPSAPGKLYCYHNN